MTIIYDAETNCKYFFQLFLNFFHKTPQTLDFIRFFKVNIFSLFILFTTISYFLYRIYKSVTLLYRILCQLVL